MADVISFTNAQITQLSHLFGDEIMTGSQITHVLSDVQFKIIVVCQQNGVG